MTFSAIMVGVDFDAGAQERVRVAASLAARFDAHLIGVAGWTLRSGALAEVPEAEESIGALQREQRVAKELERLGDRFREWAGSNRNRLEWRWSETFPREFIPASARAADIVVIGRELLAGDAARTYDPGTIILTCGRPVLVVPRGIDRLALSRVLIAWKDTREARRAVRDALPLLKAAESVCIAAVNQHNVDAQIADVMRYLGRHNVQVDSQIATVGKESDGVLLLELATEQQADLIVAGAYGRTRLSEWIFGGTTRHLLVSDVAIPCMFSN